MHICRRIRGRARIHKHMLNKETLLNFYLPQQSNTLIENNCQNSPQVSTHNIAKTKMPHGSMLVDAKLGL